MKIIVLILGNIILLGMGDPLFMPTPKQPGLIPEIQSTTSNLNQVKRSPEERKYIQQQREETTEELNPQQQLMEPHSTQDEKIK